MMLARRPGATSGSGSPSGCAASPSVGAVSLSGCDHAAARTVASSTLVTEAAASSASSSSVPTLVGPSQLSSAEVGAGPTCVSGSGPSNRCSPDVSPMVGVRLGARSGLVRSPSTGTLTTPSPFGRVVFLRLLILFLEHFFGLLLERLVGLLGEYLLERLVGLLGEYFFRRLL